MRFPSSLVLCTLALATLIGCSKGAPYSAPPPPPPTSVGKPEASFSASAESIVPGESVRLRWTSRNATEAVIEPGAGPVALSGTLDVTPTADTTYTLWLKGPGGETTATARVGVRRAAPLRSATGVDDANRSGRRLFSDPFEEEVAARLQDIYFDYNSMAIRPDQQSVLDENARTLRALFEEFTTGRVIVEGHCDERGSSEYNLALGDRRARAIVDYMAQQGVPLGRVMLVSYGEESPQCTQANEACYRLNRRGHFNARQ